MSYYLDSELTGSFDNIFLFPIPFPRYDICKFCDDELIILSAVSENYAK